jgi:hypothetical protein
LTDDECLVVVKALDADSAPVGIDYASKAATAIMRFYPKNDAQDPEAYMLAMAAIMSEYPRGVLDLIKDPRTGIARRLKFLPRLAEIAEACDYEMERRKALRLNAGYVMWHRHRSSDRDYVCHQEMMTRAGVPKPSERF